MKPDTTQRTHAGEVVQLVQLRPKIAGGPRSRVLSAGRMTKAQRAEVLAMPAEYPEGAVRPKTRADCLEGGHNAQRPCGWVSCSMHLAVDVEHLGRIRLNFPDVEIDEMAETCALDLAARGGMTLEEIGAALQVTRECVRQLEAVAIRKVKARSKGLPDDEARRLRELMGAS